MHDASLATRAKVQFLAVAGPQTPDNAGTFLASLAQGGCDLVFAVGAAPVAAGAARLPGIRFYVVGDGRGAGNVSVLDGDDPRVRGDVSRVITKAVEVSSR